MNEEELKKGCGKEAGFITFTDDFGNKDEDVMLCGDTTKKINGEIELFLCDTCQARLEYFQKGKLEVINKLKKKFKSNITVISKREFLNELEQLQKEIEEEKQNENS